VLIPANEGHLNFQHSNNSNLETAGSGSVGESLDSRSVGSLSENERHQNRFTIIDDKDDDRISTGTGTGQEYGNDNASIISSVSEHHGRFTIVDTADNNADIDNTNTLPPIFKSEDGSMLNMTLDPNSNGKCV
jgi:hypothetical protein